MLSVSLHKTTHIPIRDITSSLSQAGTARPYVRLFQGRWQRIRTALQTIAFLLLSLIPWLEYQGRQAIHLDFERMTAHFFGLHMGVDDLFGLALLIWLALFGWVCLTLYVGRLWCGLLCPQTLWTFLYIKIETLCEGHRHQRMKLDQQLWSWGKVRMKVSKHILWLLVALYTSLMINALWVHPLEVYQFWKQGMFLEAAPLSVVLVTLFIYINAGWMRERFCQHACPYARLQSVLIDTSTRVVHYKASIGEPRFQPNINMQSQGHCVDCKLCVQVCPAGIDIRQGFQYACIQCGACIDACRHVMKRKKIALKLISFVAPFSKPTERPKRHVLKRRCTLSLFVISLIGFVFFTQTHTLFTVRLLTDRQVIYRTDPLGRVYHPVMLEIHNTTSKKNHFSWRVKEPSSGLWRLVGQGDIPAYETYSYELKLYQELKKHNDHREIKVCFLADDSFCQFKSIKIGELPLNESPK